MGKARRKRPPIWSDIVVIAFAIASMVLLALELHGAQSATHVRLIHTFDLFVALFFLGDFTFRLRAVKNKGRFLLWHWWELLAAVPVTTTVTQALRGLKLLRVFELISVVRASARLEVAGEVFGGLTEYPFLIEAISTLLAVMFASAMGFFALEYGKNPAVHSLWDAFWWAGTNLTGGNADIYPVTTLGRVLALVVMLIGLATAALATATIIRYVALRKKR